jgi:hypothetical protein
MNRPGSSFQENPHLGTIAERVLTSTLDLAQRSEGEAARMLADRLELAQNLGEFEVTLAIALLCERVLDLEERLQALEGSAG